MDAISHAEVVNLLSGWEQQNKKIAVMGFNAGFTISSRNGRVTLCLDDMLQLTFGEDGIVRFFLRGASFWPVDKKDLPTDSGDWFAGFEKGVQLRFASPEMQCFLFAAERH
jgi:hypothetical protein